MGFARSAWAEEPVRIGKDLDSIDWEGAGLLDLEGAGHALVKNDAQFLYLGIDVAADMVDNVDYFWLVLDANGDGLVTPNVDRMYSPWPKRGVLGKVYCLGPGIFTGLMEPEPGCELSDGFGPSPANPVPHRFWTMRIPLTELGVTLVADRVPPVLDVGFRIASLDSSEYHWSANFGDMHEIVLATRPASAYPPGTEGAVIGGIGLIPATAIDINGRATTLSTYALPVTDAAFGGALNVIGNRATLQYLWALGARRHRVLYTPPGAGAAAPLRQAWVNYRWDGRRYVPESWSPDSTGSYALPDPSQDYSIDDLLVRWQSDHGAAPGLHRLEIEFLRADGTVVAPPRPESLTLLVANAGPRVSLDAVRGPMGDVPACGRLPVGRPVTIDLTARDDDAGLGSYEVWARWGEGRAHAIHSAAYTPPGPWNGGSYSHSWTPSDPCAYAFEVVASSRVTDGYSPSIRSGRASRFITVG